MWIVDDDGDMFNTDYYSNIIYDYTINLYYGRGEFDFDVFEISKDHTTKERLTRYYDLVEKLTGERIDI